MDFVDSISDISDNFVIDSNSTVIIDHDEFTERCSFCSSYDMVFLEGFLVCKSCGMCDSKYVPICFTDPTVSESKKAEGFEFTGEEMSCSKPTTTTLRHWNTSYTKRDYLGSKIRGNEQSDDTFTTKKCDEYLQEKLKREGRTRGRKPFFAMVNLSDYQRRSGVSIKGRYQQSSHYTTSVLSKWGGLSTNYLDQNILERAKDIFESEEFGPCEYISRGVIELIIKKINKEKLQVKKISKQDWWQFYEHIKGKIPHPPSELTDWCLTMYKYLVNSFNVIKTKEDKRKSFLSVPYVHRKILEAKGFRQWHWQFSLLKVNNKVKQLDKMMYEICKHNKFPFTWTVLYK